MKTNKYNFKKELLLAEQYGNLFANKERPTYDELFKFTNELIDQYNAAHCFNRLFQAISDDQMNNDNKVVALTELFKTYKKIFYKNPLRSKKSD